MEQPEFQRPFGICLTDLELTDGSSPRVVRVSESCEGRIVLGYRSLTERYIMVGVKVGTLHI